MPVVPMSLDTWNMSFAKYLELRFHGSVYTRRAGVSVCSHSLHHEHYQYFGCKQIVASFRWVGLCAAVLVSKHRTNEDSMRENPRLRGANGCACDCVQMWDKTMKLPFFRYYPIQLREICLPPIVIHLVDKGTSLVKIMEDVKLISFK